MQEKILNTNPQSSSKTIYYLDIGKWIASFAVVLCHTLNGIARVPSQYMLSQHDANIYMAFSKLTYWAVPVFLMVSGVLYFSPEKNISFKKIILHSERRLLLALLVFGFPMCFLENLYDYSLAELPFVLISSFSNLLTGKCWNHMWYLYMLIGLLLVVPVIRQFLDNASNKDIQMILLILFIFDSVFRSLADYGIIIGFDFPIVGIYLFYMILGYYSHYRIQNKWMNCKLWIPILVIAIIGVFSYQYLFPKHDLQYYSPLIILLGWSVFCLFRTLEPKSDLLSKWRNISFGVYILHPVFINISYKVLGITPVVLGRFSTPILFALVFYVLALITTLLLYQIKFIRKYVL